MSRYKEYVPNERIVDRAVALWMTMLQNPKYDNVGDDSPESPESIRVNTLSSLLAGSMVKNNTVAVLAKFGQELRAILLNKFTLPPSANGHVFEPRYVSRLDVDYHPCCELRTAAERAGLKMEFPWKTCMSLTENYLYVGYGYGASYVYHYPLTNDRWLATTLAGDDIGRVIALIESGVIDAQLNPLTPA